MSENIAFQLTKLSHHAIIELFELDARELGGEQLFFANGVNALGLAIVWQGQQYEPWPIEAEGFEKATTGPAARPLLRMSNVLGLVGALVREVAGLRGAKVIRKRTLAKYLDAVNFAGGVNPTADPNVHWDEELWLIDRRAPSDRKVIVFELANPMDLANVQVPGCQVLADVCVVEYRGPDCGYTGPPVAKADDTPTTSLLEDACGHCLRSCKLRQWPNNELGFGGFPGAGSIQAL